MIFTPRGWTRRSTFDGIALFPPGGPDVGHLLYWERMRPLVPVLDIFRRQLGATADSSLLRPRMVITSEGEYAAVATVRDPAGQVQHDLGVVLLDDFYSLLHAVTREPAQFAERAATLLDLVLHDLHQLGDRRRRYLYEAPASWQGRPRGLETDYFPLDFPKQDLMVTVMPAFPRPEGATCVKYVEALLAQQRAESAVEEIGGPVAVRTPLLPGCELAWTTPSQGRRVSRRAVVLEDSRYLYPVLLEGSSDLRAAREPFLSIINSIEPIPAPRAVSGTSSPPAPALTMWEG